MCYPIPPLSVLYHPALPRPPFPPLSPLSPPSPIQRTNSSENLTALATRTIFIFLSLVNSNRSRRLLFPGPRTLQWLGPWSPSLPSVRGDRRPGSPPGLHGRPCPRLDHSTPCACIPGDCSPIAGESRRTRGARQARLPISLAVSPAPFLRPIR